MNRRGPSPWTPERDALLAKLGAVSRDFEGIRASLNALPGRLITTANAVRICWYQVLNGPHADGLRRSRGKWTDERVNLMLALRHEGVEWPEIRQAINKLPGLPLPNASAVQSQFNRIKRDSQGTAPANEAGAAAGQSPAALGCVSCVSSLNLPPASKAPEAFFHEKGALLVSYEDAKRWAIREGLMGRKAALNLIAVNAVRVQRGQAKLQIRGAL